MPNLIPSHWREVQLGVIEFHSENLNPGLIKRFYEVRDDLTAAACIVDLWLFYIRAVLREFGYEMKVYSTKEPATSTVMTEQSHWPYERKSDIPHGGGCDGDVWFHEINEDHGDCRCKCFKCGKEWIEEGPDS